MAQYRQLIVDVENLTPGKFYKLYTDSNATTLLISKDEEDQLELDVEQLKSDIEDVKKQNDNQTITISSSVSPSRNNEVKKLLVRNFVNIEIAELSANAVIVEYCLYEGKNIECGRLTIIDDDQLIIDEDRVHQNKLLPVSFSANRLNDKLNLRLDVSQNIIYTFKYKLTIF